MNKVDKNGRIGSVLSCAPECILVEIENIKIFEENKKDLQIGRYLKIAQGNNDYTIAVIRNIKGNKKEDKENGIVWSFIIDCQAIGTLVGDETFERGSVLLPVPTEPVYIAKKDTYNRLFKTSKDFDFPFGKLSFNKNVQIKINGNRFFSKHIAVVGSTGSGKSCTVAKIIHDVVGIENDGYTNKEK